MYQQFDYYGVLVILWHTVIIRIQQLDWVWYKICVQSQIQVYLKCQVNKLNIKEIVLYWFKYNWYLINWQFIQYLIVLIGVYELLISLIIQILWSGCDYQRNQLYNDDYYYVEHIYVVFT